MPELPEVETTLRGIRPFLENQPLVGVNVRVPRLRTLIPADTEKLLTGRALTNFRRRNKYILADVEGLPRTLLVHLGMSGRFSILPPGDGSVLLAKHDHVILTTALAELRYNDPRRFGMFDLLETAGLHQHPLLKDLGPEPLTEAFDGTVLHASLKGKKTPIKPVIMDARVVCGVGNIYASESLFRAGISPLKPAGKLSAAQCDVLAGCIKAVLAEAIVAGGSTLKDYAQPDGQLGYFAHNFKVYGRKGQPCTVCGGSIAQMTQAQRSTFYCGVCQRG